MRRLRFNVEYSPMASSEFEGGRHPEAAMEMIRLLEQVLRNSRAVDREALCVLAGQKVSSWYAGQHLFDAPKAADLPGFPISYCLCM